MKTLKILTLSLLVFAASVQAQAAQVIFNHSNVSWLVGEALTLDILDDGFLHVKRSVMNEVGFTVVFDAPVARLNAENLALVQSLISEVSPAMRLYSPTEQEKKEWETCEGENAITYAVVGPQYNEGRQVVRSYYACTQINLDPKTAASRRANRAMDALIKMVDQTLTDYSRVIYGR